MLRLGLFFVALLCPLHFALASSLDDQIDEVIQKYVAKDLFSGTIAIKNSNGIIFQRSYGLAVREHQVPNKIETVFGIGSLSKQFTAAGVLYLQQTGQLNVNNKISEYLEVPTSWNELTIRQFLTHSSGIPANPSFSPSTEWAKFRSLSELFDLLKLQFSLIPTERQGKFEYSNAGYSVMAKLISVVAKEEYATFMNRFFQAAQLKNTAVDHESMITMNQAIGYTIHDGKWYRACCLDLSNFAGSGDMRSSVEDLLRWSDLLKGNSFFHDETKEQLFEAKVPMGAPNQFYGYGWVTEPFLGKKMIWHNGSLRGFMSMMAMYDQETTFVLVGNQNNIPLSKIRDEVMTLVFSSSTSK